VRIGEICCRDVVFARQNDTALDAARLMERFHVGDVVVVAEEEGLRVPVGIVTDRDLAVKVTARGLAPERTLLEDVASADLLTVGEDDELYDAIDRMRRRGVRRTPVVDLDGALAGILSVDDILGVLAEELTGLVRLVSREQAPKIAGP
jgi:CBS domain-containing protein